MICTVLRCESILVLTTTIFIILTTNLSMATVLNNRYIRRARSSVPACNHVPLSSHSNKPSLATGCRSSLAGSTYPRTARSSATSCASRCSSLRNAGSVFRMSGRWHHTSLQLSEKTHLENLQGICRPPIWFFTADFLNCFNCHTQKHSRLGNGEHETEGNKEEKNP